MNNMKRLLLLFPVMLVMLMTSCLKDDLNQETIMLMGTEENVKPINEVIPDTLLSFIADDEAMGSMEALSLPRGNTPPDIQGEYAFGPIQLGADNGHGVPRNDTIYIRFGGDQEPYLGTSSVQFHPGDILIQGSDTLVFAADTTMQIEETFYYYPEGQHNRMVPCDIYGDVMEKGDVYLPKSQPQAYVMGNGNNFTAYFIIDYDCEFQGDSYKIKRGYILTGTITSAGIDHAVLACVNVSVDEISNQGFVNPPQKDYVYVYRVKSNDNQYGMAKRVQWYQH